ncbi:MAG: FAD-dependent oxidoreductase [Kiritimatiellae bacterium]|nr:FAD-dependent oxidoreductase [Kiritimatiellia bacterium]
MDYCTLVDGEAVRSEWTGGFHQTCDVAVVGLGTAGALALIAAAREGMTAVGLEALSFMGGVGTGGAINYYYWGTQGGIQDELDAACRELEPRYAPFDPNRANRFHPDVKKYVLEDAARRAGAAMLYRAKLTGVFMEGERVVGVQAITARGARNIRSRVVIDASGDAQACAAAGCRCRLGREFDGQPQPYSAPRGTLNTDGSVGHANFDAGYVDPRNAEDLSRAICLGHGLHLRDRYEAEPARLLWLAPLLGIREGRFVECEETIAFADVIGERARERVVMQMNSHHDNHAKDWAFESDVAREWTTVCGFWGRRLLAQVPYGALVPRGVDGLLVAGRCISLDHDSAQSFRMQRDMQKTGEIAGVAAALAVRDNCAVRDVPYAKLKRKLEASGCLPRVFESPAPWLADRDEIRQGLASAAPGVAIWSCRRIGERIVEPLLAWSQQAANPDLQKHAAFALGLLRHEAALPVLRDIVRHGDTSEPDVKRRPQKRKHAALFLLGLLGDRAATDLLLDVARGAQDDFQDFTHALTALLRIARKHAGRREIVARTLGGIVSGPHFSCRLPLQVSGSMSQQPVVEDMTQYVRVVLRRELSEWGLDPEPCVALDPSRMTWRDRRMLISHAPRGSHHTPRRRLPGVMPR